jgi:hypothetical protein
LARATARLSGVELGKAKQAMAVSRQRKQYIGQFVAASGQSRHFIASSEGIIAWGLCLDKGSCE